MIFSGKLYLKRFIFVQTTRDLILVSIDVDLLFYLLLLKKKKEEMGNAPAKKGDQAENGKFCDKLFCCPALL